MLLLSSCSMESETHINKDGSGTSEFTMDMGGMIEMMGGMGGMMGGDQGPGMEGEDDSVKDAMGTMKEKEFSTEDFMGLMDTEDKIDSTVNMYAVMPDSLKGNPYAKYLKNVSMRVITDKAEGIAKFSFKMNYKDAEEYANINQAFVAMEGESAEPGKKTPEMQDMMTLPQVDTKKGIVIIPEQDWNEIMGDDMPGGGMGGMGLGGDDEDGEDSEGEAMMAMMFGDSGFKSTYHLPGRVEFTNMRNAEISGNSVTFFRPMGEFMDNMKTPKYVIKYKP